MESADTPYWLVEPQAGRRLPRAVSRTPGGEGRALYEKGSRDAAHEFVTAEQKEGADGERRNSKMLPPHHAILTQI